MTDFSLNQPDLLIQVERLISEGRKTEAQKDLLRLWEKKPSSPEQCYLIGNLMLVAGIPHVAKQAWERSHQLRLDAEPSGPRPTAKIYSSPGLIVFGTLILLMTFYLVIVALFPRHQPILFSMSFGASGQPEPRSFWEEFWNTDRIYPQQFQRNDAEDFWPMLQEELRKLMGEQRDQQAEGPPKSVDQLVGELLQRYRNAKTMRQQPMDYHILLGRGFYNTRDYLEARDVLELGLSRTDNQYLKGILHQEMGTIHYYKGYRLQPDGLAKYDLEEVRRSVQDYERAARYIESHILYGNLGWGYYLLGDYEQAESASFRAIEIARNRGMEREAVYVWMNLGLVYLRTNQYHNAFNAYKSALRLQPGFEEYIGGLRDLRELKRDHPGQYPFADLVLGYFHVQEGQFTQARQHLKDFMSQAPGLPAWKDFAKDTLEQISNPS